MNRSTLLIDFYNDIILSFVDVNSSFDIALRQHNAKLHLWPSYGFYFWLCLNGPYNKAVSSESPIFWIFQKIKTKMTKWIHESLHWSNMCQFVHKNGFVIESLSHHIWPQRWIQEFHGFQKSRNCMHNCNFVLWQYILITGE